MAIKISGTTVIDNSRNLTNIVTISANGGVGTAGQVLTSGASGNVYWATAGGVTTGKAIAMAIVFG